MKDWKGKREHCWINPGVSFRVQSFARNEGTEYRDDCWGLCRNYRRDPSLRV